jgi:hypothetical protein
MDIRLDNVEREFPAEWDEGQVARAKTRFFQALALEAHRFYGGKIQILPRAPLPGFQWFNAWYTPGVSAISTGIRDNHDESFELSWRGNAVAVVTDSTRVLGDGDVSPSGGLGVMEGKAFLMKMLGGVDAVPICFDSRNAAGPQRSRDPDRCRPADDAIVRGGESRRHQPAQLLPRAGRLARILRHPGLARRRPGHRLRDARGVAQRAPGGRQGARGLPHRAVRRRCLQHHDRQPHPPVRGRSGADGPV